MYTYLSQLVQIMQDTDLGDRETDLGERDLDRLGDLERNRPPMRRGENDL